MTPSRSYRSLTRAPIVFGVGKALSTALASLPFVRAAPTYLSTFLFTKAEEGPKPADDPSLWIYLSVAGLLVLLGGAFAGLTIALMGQDEIYLKVIQESGEGAEQKYAERVLRLLNKGKHWVLVALLLSNVITNETLPIVLDRSLGGGWPAVLGSTVLIVIFGEIAPQSVCVRYGLPIGSWMAPFVLVLMYILAPVAWPTAKLLDWLLGKDHGTVYKKAGLKTLVSLHKSLGDHGQNLVDDEVTIIGAVLDLKDKTIGSIMTPMEDVFTMSLDDTLDEHTMDVLLSQGFSRIPIHHPDNDRNFVGMLLVKMLITYDPEDARPVRDFALATLPESRADTSCLDIINFFQQGKSHMVLVSDHPGQDHGALGVVTLEDVIEELIGEEIVDESDVFIDVHKALRRTQLAPRTRVARGAVIRPETPHAVAQESDLVNVSEGTPLSPLDMQRVKTMEAFSTKTKSQERTASPRQSSIPLRRRSSAADSKGHRYNTAEMREHLKHMAPSNQASRPNPVRSTTVVIKPGTNGPPAATPGVATPARRISESAAAYHGGIGEGVVVSGGKDASDGVQAVKAGYGSANGSPSTSKPAPSANKSTPADLGDLIDLRNPQAWNGSRQEEEKRHDDQPSRSYLASANAPRDQVSGSPDTLNSLRRKDSRSSAYTPRGPARSGSITENIVDSNGIRKVVLEMTSSSSNEEENNGTNKGLEDTAAAAAAAVAETTTAKKKRRRKRRKAEEQPLLGAGY